jgi:hypothetical protein
MPRFSTSAVSPARTRTYTSPMPPQYRHTRAHASSHPLLSPTAAAVASTPEPRIPSAVRRRDCGCSRTSTARAGKYGAWHDYLQYLHRHGKGARPPPGNDPNVHTKKTQVLQQAVCATGGAALPRCAVQITFLKSLRRCDRKGDVQVMGRSRWMHIAWQRILRVRTNRHKYATRPLPCTTKGGKRTVSLRWHDALLTLPIVLS